MESSHTCQAIGVQAPEWEPLVLQEPAPAGAPVVALLGEESGGGPEAIGPDRRPLGLRRRVMGWRKPRLRILVRSGAAMATLCVGTLIFLLHGSGGGTGVPGATGDTVHFADAAAAAGAARLPAVRAPANVSSSAAAATTAAATTAAATTAVRTSATNIAQTSGTKVEDATAKASKLTKGNNTATQAAGASAKAAAVAKSNSTNTQAVGASAKAAAGAKSNSTSAQASGNLADGTPTVSNATTAAAFAGNSTEGNSSTTNSSRGISLAVNGSGGNLTTGNKEKSVAAVDDVGNSTVVEDKANSTPAATDVNSTSNVSLPNASSSAGQSLAGDFSASPNGTQTSGAADTTAAVSGGSSTASATTSTSSTSTTSTTTTDLANCATYGEDCNPSKCCRDPGMQCYAKHDYFAACRKSCSPGPDPLDVDDTSWSCKKIGKRTPGSKDPCAAIGEDCSSAQCCTDTGMQCYRKNSTWSTCLEYCPRDAGIKGWSCEELGARNSGRSYWVDQKCSSIGEDCTWSKCCTSPGMVCYEKNQWWAACKGYCKPGINRADPEEFRTNWSCNVLGFRAPQTVDQSRQKVVLSAEAPAPECAGSGESCAVSRCCRARAENCIWTNASGAMCSSDCEVQRRATVLAKDGTSTLNVRGSRGRTPGCELLPRRGSLFCFMLVVAESYESGLVTAQYKKGAGIFACDDYSVLAVGNFSKGNKLDAIAVPREYVGVSKDGTAGNTMQFMRAWEVIFKDGRFRHHHWVVKVDADSVLVPHRLRRFLLPHVGETAYLVNCNRYPDSPDFPMMYGSLEVFSAEAVQIYKDRGWHCAAELSWGAWGEDYFMTKCLDYLGVARITALSLVGDENCMGAFCGDGWSAAYHPFKDLKAWMKCWDEAMESQNLVSV